MITKGDIENWYNDPVTKEFFNAVEIRIDDVKEVLFSSAGQNPDADNFNRGYGVAYTEISEFEFEYVDKDTD